ncbi:MAG: spondin domain-containing protein [Cyanobacteria bacterium P01_D01_bin.1]
MSDTQVIVSIENLAPENGTALTPLWVSFHNGEFDTYDPGAAVSVGLERLAEDGNATILGEEFVADGNGQTAGLVGNAPILPGAIASEEFTLDSSLGNANYFSYASMILPSNDFFVSNGDPLAHEIFDENGDFVGTEFFIVGSDVLDAGTEENDEREESTAFFGQSAPNTGVTEEVVREATGFIPVEQGGNILADERFANADFTADGYEIARVVVTEEDGTVTVSIENLAPDAGTNLTPLWVGFHNGEFDLYDRGEPVSVGLERLAEDGNAAVLGEEFETSGSGQAEGTVGAAPIAPGATVTQTFSLDALQGNADYFSYASMILPSNDFFVANGDPLAHRIFDEAGNFVGADFVITGSEVLDAGTEVSDEIPENTAFFGQEAPDTGVIEGVVQPATGFIPNGRILSAEQFAAGDFTAEGYQVARVEVSEAPVVEVPITEVTVTVENLAPTNGTSLTPVWVGFHSGEFDTYDLGEAVTEGIERIAEDGDATVLGEEFADSGFGSTAGLVGGGPIAPGSVVSQTFSIDPDAQESSYFSYASMILPSNDFFVSNADPLANQIFDEEGNFLGADFFVLGSQVVDAGTEVNDEAADSTAFFGQSTPNTGEAAENSVATAATGFIPEGRILSAEQFAAADFTAQGYEVARVRVTAGDAVPESEVLPTASVEGDNLVLVRGNGSVLELSFSQRNASEVNEVIMIATQNTTGTINGIAPGEEGYTAAVIDGAQTVFSALQRNEFSNFNPTRTFGASSGQFLQFAVIQGGSLETLRNDGIGELLLATPAGNADGESAVSIESLGDSQLQLSFRTPDGGGSSSLGDLVVDAEFTSADAPLGTALQNELGLEVIDLRGETGPVDASFEILREAGFDNQIGFYQIENELGQVLAEDGVTLISVEDEGYQAAALARRLDDVLLGGVNGRTVTSEVQFAGDQLLAPFIVSDGTVDQLLDAESESDPSIFFAYLGANSDGVDHVRLLGNNTFGFEDIAGGGDLDFDDVVVRTTFG